MDLDLYRYYIGREDQSVNEKIMASRIDQQIRITKIMIDSHNVENIIGQNKKLGKYMRKYLTMMMTICQVFCELCEYEDKNEKRKDVWKYLKEKDKKMYTYIRYKSVFGLACMQSFVGRKVGLFFYKIAQKLYKFN